MGKALQHHHPRIFVQGNDPSGCMWGVLHVLNYQNWRQIKKRLPHRKGGSGSSKHAPKADNLEDNANALKIDASIDTCDDENEDPIVDEKLTQCSTPSKGSIASRFKALISEEISKFKSRHHRSATCPIQSQLTQQNSINHLEPFYDDIIAIAKLHEEHLRASIVNRTSSTPSLMDSTQFPLIDRKFEECETSLTSSPLNLKQFERTRKEVHKNSDNSVENLEHRNYLNLDSSTHDTLDTLDSGYMANTKKDSISEMLETSSSPLAQNFQNQLATENKLRYSKTVSFPSTESSYKIGSRPGKLEHQEEVFFPYTKEDKTQNIGHKKQKLEGYRSKEYFRSNSTPIIAAEYRADGILKLNQAMGATANKEIRKNSHNQVVVKRFKDLRHKIQHAIKERKHEKHRIAMDAILHKIPHRHGFSKDLRKEIFDQTRDFRDSPRSSYESYRSLPSTIKSEQRSTSRTSSFNESLDRYCQLYECSFSKEAKQYNAETSKLISENGNSSRMGATKSMRRIVSLPNIKYTEASSYSFIENQVNNFTDGNEDHGHPTSTEQVMQENANVHSSFSSLRDLDKAITSNDEQAKLESISTIEMDACPVEFGANARNITTNEVEFESTPPVFTNSITDLEEEEGNVSALNYEGQETNTTVSPLFKLQVFTEEDLEPRQTHPAKLEVLCEKLEDISMDTSNMPKTKYDKSEHSCDSFLEKSLQLQLKVKYKAEFDYVRDILDISGVIKNEPLGICHFEDRPLDRSALEAMKHYIFLDPKCSRSEESVSSYQILLFDLINEVLMDIYANLNAYYPNSLTSLSKIRPLPIGHHVFEEVWDDIGWYLNFSHETDDHQSLDYVVSRDLAKSGGWMNVQNEVECVGLELEDLIFNHLLEEIIFS